MGGIATIYGVKTKDLKAANAEIDPRMIPIGTVLIIPSGNPEQDANKPTAIPDPGCDYPDRTRLSVMPIHPAAPGA